MQQTEQHILYQLSHGQLTGAKRLDLSCGLTEVPSEIYGLADSLEVLNLSGNALTTLPDDIARLSKLKVLFCSDNQFDHVPEVLGQCKNLTMVGFKANKINTLSAKSLPKNLQWLILTDNQLTFLPKELGECKYLQKLMLAGNQLTTLPSEMTACKQLELLRISANQLTELPEWVYSLPKLSWLAYAGNLFCSDVVHEKPASQQLFNIPWSKLDIKQKLGEGASGLIYQADWQEKKPVAVKLFKGSVTSDGMPENEMAACILAGEHRNLCKVEGLLSEHPEGKVGLVMSLISADYKNLANPPSFATCTRDVYDKEIKLPYQNVLKIAQSIANVMQHLHSKGILHGDLYAHNIMYNDSGDCLLSDFGAASFFTVRSKAALALQRIEVRAFACLLEELIAHCEVEDLPALDSLRKLQFDCAHADVESRPLFVEIVQRLNAI